LLDVSTPPDTRFSKAVESGPPTVLAQPSVDEQYAAAFRRWGLDVDSTAESEVVARLRQEPDAVVQEVIAGLDGWTLERRQKRDEAGWRRLHRIADQLDRSVTRRQLRTLILKGSSPGAGAVTGLVGAGSPWLAC
jgi:hypothetical protein